MLKRIDHLGVAVSSIAARLPAWQALGAGSPGAPEIEEVASERVKVAMLGVGESRIELLEALAEDSVIAGFVRERGEGVHHVCFAVDDIERALERVRASGLRVIEPAPRIGAGGAKVAFVHPKSLGGILIELKEDPKPGP